MSPGDDLRRFETAKELTMPETHNTDGNALPRILFLVTNLTFGGAEAQVVRLAAEMTTRGWEAAIVSLVEPEAHVATMERAGVHVHTLHMKRRLPDPRAILRLRRIVRAFQPDVVHSHMFHANLLGRTTRVLTRISALVCTIHNLRETSERGGPTWHKEALYRITDKLADRTTIICQTAFDRHVRLGAVPAAKLRVMPNFVDTRRFSPDDRRRAAFRHALGLRDEFVWLAVGRLVKQKDYPNLLRAVCCLRAERMKVLVAGSGPLGVELQELARTLGLENTVQFLGTGNDVLDLYNAADAYVMPSQFEGLSVALLEAGSMSLPAVVTHAGGNGEIVNDGTSGYVVPCEDSTALAAAMRRMMQLSPAARTGMGKNARELCVQRFDSRVVVQQWLDLYEEVRAEKPSRAETARFHSLPEAVPANRRAE
jgi:glycosyltransferase involved in cell wall biosynthesis